MLFATRSVMVNAPVEAIWSTLVDKAEHPEKYMPFKPEILKIHETFPNGLLREIKTEQMHLFERVTFDKNAGVVKFSVENHPVYSGFIVEKVTPPEDPGGLPLLTFTMDLQPKSATAEQQPEAQWFLNAAKPELIYNGVNHLKEIIERNHPRFDDAAHVDQLAVGPGPLVGAGDVPGGRVDARGELRQVLQRRRTLPVQQFPHRLRTTRDHRLLPGLPGESEVLCAPHPESVGGGRLDAGLRDDRHLPPARREGVHVALQRYHPRQKWQGAGTPHLHGHRPRLGGLTPAHASRRDRKEEQWQKRVRERSPRSSGG